MTSQIEICNNALAAVGTRSTISSLDEGSNESLQCKLQYDSTFNALLRSAHWNFARRFTTLALLRQSTGVSPWDTTQPPPPWKYQYQYPTDCLALRYVIGQEIYETSTPIFTGSMPSITTPAQPARYARVLDVDANGIESQTVCTNAPSAMACYTRAITDVNQLDSLALTAFINALASQIAFALTGDKALAKLLADQANAGVLQARLADANETTTVIDQIPDWLAVRPGFSGMSGLNAFAPEYGPLFEVK